MVIEDFFRRQQELQKKIGNDLGNLTFEDREKWTKEFVLAMHAELTEVLDWINWKHWKKTRVKYDAQRINEIQMEIIDLFHFLLNLCQIWGVSPIMFEALFLEKHKINMERQEKGY